MHHAIAVAVVEGDQIIGFPIYEPFGRVRIGLLIDRFDEIDPGKGADCRCGRVEERDEDQRPTRRFASVACTRHGKETNDDMGQPGRADHQRGRDAENVDHRFAAIGIGGEANVGQRGIELFEHI